MIGFHNDERETVDKTVVSTVKKYTQKEMVSDVVVYSIGMSLVVGCIVTVLGWAFAFGALGLLLMLGAKRSMKRAK